MIASIVQVILFILIAVFLGQYFIQQRATLRDTTLTVNPFLLVIAGAGFAIGMGTIPIGTSIIVLTLGNRFSWLDLWHTFYLSQVMKYLPGGIWTLPSRAYLFNRRGLTGPAAIEAVFWEACLLLGAACGVAILGIPLLLAMSSGMILLLILGGFVLAFSCAVLLVQTPLYRQLINRLPMKYRFEYQMPLHRLIPVVVAYIATWLITGFSFAVLVRAFDETLSLIQAIQLAGFFAAAWAIGFLAFFAPGGIGVRDSLIILGTQQLLNDPLPLVIAIVARLCWTIAEVSGLIIVSLIYIQRKNRHSPELLIE